ncbi:hypothetical protein K466DRAFT_81149 [Polyporus arcularius HHB13444]|uniref:Uncharacterized protein n=1 Tax=Polyporus arcularius HHB13444 TaxID=1314778 RepID=A0A5C3PZZ1_9APHY|nr:hypothetical protein K466DRAFT_81149 [Polyporus arcularius HHB13444]
MNQSNAEPSKASARHRRRCRLVPQGDVVTRAYGLLINLEDLHRLTRRYHFEVWGTEERISKATPEEVEEIILDERGATLSRIPRQVYRYFPDFPRLRRNILLLDPGNGIWLFVMKDNSSYPALHAPVGPEEVRKVQKLLGLEHVPVKWYKVPPGS